MHRVILILTVEMLRSLPAHEKVSMCKADLVFPQRLHKELAGTASMITVAQAVSVQNGR